MNSKSHNHHRAHLFCRLLAILLVIGQLGALNAWATPGAGGEPGGNHSDTPSTSCGTCNQGDGAAKSGAKAPKCTGAPIHLLRGSVIESATDAALSGAILSWSHSRTYDSNLADGGNLSLSELEGSRWQGNGQNAFLHKDTVNNTIELYVDASSKRVFTNPQTSGGVTTYTSPVDYNVTLSQKTIIDSEDYDNDGDTGDVDEDKTYRDDLPGIYLNQFRNGRSFNLPWL